MSMIHFRWMLAVVALTGFLAVDGRPIITTRAGRNSSDVFNVVDYGAVGDDRCEHPVVQA